MQKLGNIGARRQRYLDRRPPIQLVIIERQPLAHLTRRIPHHGIGVGIVVRRPVEDLHPQRALLQQLRPSRQRIFHHIIQQRRVALAVAEVGTAQYLLQLKMDRLAVFPRLRVPHLSGCAGLAHREYRIVLPLPSPRNHV